MLWVVDYHYPTKAVCHLALSCDLSYGARGALGDFTTKPIKKSRSPVATWTKILPSLFTGRPWMNLFVF